MPMEEYLIYKTMARFCLSYEQALEIIKQLFLKDELEGYAVMIDKFNVLRDLKDYYKIK